MIYNTIHIIAKKQLKKLDMKRVEVDKDLSCEIGLLAHKYVDGGAEYKLTLIDTEANVL
jgi:hypothetical protein